MMHFVLIQELKDGLIEFDTHKQMNSKIKILLPFNLIIEL